MSNTPLLIFRNNVGICSSSNGKVPHNKAYKITPQLHTSTSGPAYSFPAIGSYSEMQNFTNEKSYIN